MNLDLIHIRKRKNEVERLQRTNEVQRLQSPLNNCSKNDTLAINPNISNKTLCQSQFNISKQQTKVTRNNQSKKKRFNNSHSNII